MVGTHGVTSHTILAGSGPPPSTDRNGCNGAGAYLPPLPNGHIGTAAHPSPIPNGANGPARRAAPIETGQTGRKVDRTTVTKRW